MTNFYFQELMQELGFHPVDTVAMGVYKEWPLTIRLKENQLELRIAVPTQAKACLKKLKEKELEHITWSFEKDTEPQMGYVLVADMQMPSDFYVKSTVHTALSAVVLCLEQGNYTPQTTCALCTGASCEGWAYVNEECRAVHRHCLSNKLSLPEQDVTIKQKTYGSYWRGILGALLGATLAALPNWAQALSDASLNQILYIFLPFMAVLLYRLFRGKANLAVAGISVLLASFLVTFGMELIWFWVVATEQAGRNISFAETTSLYFELYTMRLGFINMAPSLFFMIVGFFPSAILLRRYVSANTVSEQLVRGSKFVKNSAFSIEEGKSVSWENNAE